MIRAPAGLVSASASAIFGLLAFCLFSSMMCETPWWFAAAPIPFFAFAVFRIVRARSTIAMTDSRLVANAVLSTSTIFLAIDLVLSGLFLVRDLEKYGTAFRTGCGDEPTNRAVACAMLDSVASESSGR